MKLFDLNLSRTIPASPAEVYDVWMDAESPGGPWFGSQHNVVDARVGGLFYLRVEHEGTIYPHYGRFIRLERGRVAEYAWVSPPTKGLETIVTVAFEPSGKETKLTLRHTGIPDDEDGRKHNEGWTWLIDMVAQRLGGAAHSHVTALNTPS